MSELVFLIEPAYLLMKEVRSKKRPSIEADLSIFADLDLPDCVDNLRNMFLNSRPTCGHEHKYA